MKVTKRYCDICKDEIPDRVHENILINGFISMNSSECNSIAAEVCRECGVELFDKYYGMIREKKDRPAVKLCYKCANAERCVDWPLCSVVYNRFEKRGVE